jgi:16S rRNA (adenine1518-N6/adenine1519-N6)-dimethyltransferase
MRYYSSGKVIEAASFGQRRKMLRQSLKAVFEQPEAALESLGIAPTKRAEELTIGDFGRLALKV